MMSDSVTRVVDGDTVVLATLGKTRLIGMNTPETVAPAQRRGAPPQCYGPEASARTKQLLPAGAGVRVELDAEPTDKFGRSLAYLYLERDNTFINGDLVKDGYARAKAYPPNVRYKAQLAALEAEARANRRGLWGSCDDARVMPGKGFDPSRAPASSAAAAAKAQRPARTPAERRRQDEGVLASASAGPGMESRALENPGDVKNCGDFGSYAEAKAWYDTYYPAFGDVAKLDGNGDGRPCEGLLKTARLPS